MLSSFISNDADSFEKKNLSNSKNVLHLQFSEAIPLSSNDVLSKSICNILFALIYVAFAYSAFWEIENDIILVFFFKEWLF